MHESNEERARRIRIAMLRHGYSTNAELGARCGVKAATICNVVRGWNASHRTRRRIQNTLGEQFWPAVPLDFSPSTEVTQ